MVKVVVLILILIVIFAIPVSAHRPIFLEPENAQADKPYPISDPDISWAVYQELQPGKVDYYEISVPSAGLSFFAQLLVPTRPQYQGFRPNLALIGPDLPQPQEDLPVEVPRGYGAVLIPWEDKEVFFEPFTQTRYYMAKEVRRPLSQGNWQLAVYHPEGQGGKYTLAVGEKERWSWKDIFLFQAMWFKTRWWYSPGQTIALITAGLAGVALAASLAIKILQRLL